MSAWYSSRVEPMRSLCIIKVSYHDVHLDALSDSSLILQELQPTTGYQSAAATHLFRLLMISSKTNRIRTFKRCSPFPAPGLKAARAILYGKSAMAFLEVPQLNCAQEPEKL